MIVSKRLLVKRGKVKSEKLLGLLEGHFKKKVKGDVLRFAVVDVKGDRLVVDASVRVRK
mgnify:CR=1 FL=1